MKEYTLVYNAEITEVKKTEGMELAEIDKNQLAAWIEDKLGVDDVHIKGAVKVFEREL